MLDLHRRLIILARFVLGFAALSGLLISGCGDKGFTTNTKFQEIRVDSRSIPTATPDLVADKLAVQADTLLTKDGNTSDQIVATLLAIQSLKISPNAKAVKFLFQTSASPLTITTQGNLGSLIFSPDGKYVALSGSYWRSNCDAWCNEGVIQIFEVANGQEFRRINFGNHVWSTSFSPDGRYILSAGCDTASCSKGSARLWEVSSGREVFKTTSNSAVMKANFSPNGTYMATEDGNTVLVWDTKSGKEIARMTHDDIIFDLIFSPDEKYILTGSNDHTARVWEVASGEEISRMTHDDLVDFVDYDPDGNFAASGGSDNTARIWDPIVGKELYRIVYSAEGGIVGPVVGVAFSPDRKHFASNGGIAQQKNCDYGCSDYFVSLWDTSTGKEVIRRSGNGMVFNPDGKYILSTECDEYIEGEACALASAFVWEAATGKETARMSHDSNVVSAGFSPDGKYAASVSSDSFDSTLFLWPYKPEDVIKTACSSITRNLTKSEWEQYIGNSLPYEPVCPNLPTGSALSAIP